MIWAKLVLAPGLLDPSETGTGLKSDQSGPERFNSATFALVKGNGLSF